MQNNPLRVVCLFGTGIIFDKTLAILLDNNINVVAVCNANKHQKGVDFSYLKIAIKKYGIIKVFLQIVERIVYKTLNNKKDKKIFNQLYNKEAIEKALQKFTGKTHQTTNYQNPETLAFLKAQNPDIFIVHTGYWVGKKVRNIVNGNCLGGHPGITPDYRGVHSPFWAIYNNEPNKIGYTVFWVDSGIDTGDIAFQGNIIPVKDDSYFTLSWKGMIQIAQNQAKIINKLQNNQQVMRKKIITVNEKTNYTHPTIFQYIKYRIKQKQVR